MRGYLANLHDQKLSELLKHIVALVSELFGALPSHLVQLLRRLHHTSQQHHVRHKRTNLAAKKARGKQ